LKRIFAVERLAKEAGLSRRELAQISKRVKEEFPNDQMMQELHIVRAIRAKQKTVTEVHG